MARACWACRSIPTGTTLAVTENEGGTTLLDAATMRRLDHIDGPNGLRAIRWSPQGDLLAVLGAVSFDPAFAAEVHLLDRDLDVVARFTGLTASPASFAFSPDGGWLARRRRPTTRNRRWGPTSCCGGRTSPATPSLGFGSTTAGPTTMHRSGSDRPATSCTRRSSTASRCWPFRRSSTATRFRGAGPGHAESGPSYHRLRADRRIIADHAP